MIPCPNAAVHHQHTAPDKEELVSRPAEGEEEKGGIEQPDEIRVSQPKADSTPISSRALSKSLVLRLEDLSYCPNTFLTF